MHLGNPSKSKSLIVRHGSTETPEQKADRLGVPVFPATPKDTPDNGNPIVAVCGRCCRSVRRVESYSCGEADCPLRSGGSL